MKRERFFHSDNSKYDNLLIYCETFVYVINERENKGEIIITRKLGVTDVVVNIKTYHEKRKY